jgi:K+-transporting ATPase c subunit
MELFALSDAAETTIVFIFIWGIAFPGFVTGLIALALVRSYGEKLENDERRRHRRSG